jgi:cytochrome b
MAQQEIKVWDIFVRVFHWSLVLAFAVAYLTEDDWMTLHVNAGYAVAGLVALRLVWGFIGTRYARFTDFAYGPGAVKAFLNDTLHRRAKRYIGHNPAGGLMIFLMLAGLVLTSVTGLVLYGAGEGAGPLAGLTASLGAYEHTLEEAHEFLANLTLLMVFVHIAGVVVESLLHRENLARAMVTGRKRA